MSLLVINRCMAVPALRGHLLWLGHTLCVCVRVWYVHVVLLIVQYRLLYREHIVEHVYPALRDISLPAISRGPEHW